MLEYSDRSYANWTCSNRSVGSSYIRVERVSQSEKTLRKTKWRLPDFLLNSELFELRRCSGSIASLLDFLREAAMRLRHICGCYCGQFLRQLPKFNILCTTFCRSSIEGLTTKFHSLEHSHEGLILYTASFHCQYRGLSIEYVRGFRKGLSL